jgi:hypothetical protein
MNEKRQAQELAFSAVCAMRAPTAENHGSKDNFNLNDNANYRSGIWFSIGTELARHKAKPTTVDTMLKPSDS